MDEAKSILIDLPGKLQINKSQPSENKQRLFVQNLLSQESQPPSFLLGKDSTTSKEVGNEKKVRL